MISPVDSAARCIGREITERGPKVWEVSATFSKNFRTEPTEEGFPWDRLPTWSWTPETIDEPLLYDAQDNSSISNSAFEPMTPVTRPIAVPVLNISRYEQVFSPTTILAYSNMVNSQTFWGATAGQVLCAGISAAQEILDDWRIWKVAYTFRFKVDTYGWKLRLLDQGTYYWSGTVGSSQKVPFGDKAMQQIVGNLDGAGGKNSTTTPAFIEFSRYAAVDFNALQLGPWAV
jgi:hypothetical protein